MADPRVRREIALCAARLMYSRDVSEYFTAKQKAAKMIGAGDRDLPSNAEIREQILVMADLFEGDARQRELREMRVDALRVLRLLRRHRPRLIGSVLTGHVRKGSDIDVHVFADSVAAVADEMELAGYACDVERKRVLKHHEERVFTHIHAKGKFQIELTVYASDKANYPFRSSITGKTIERAGIEELEALMRREYPQIDLEGEVERLTDHADVWELYELLLRPLESVKQNPRYHPEGDALYHSLQVYALGKQAREYDQEFLLACLLHDVGKAIDPSDHVGAGLAALEGAITERTAWLIEHHMEAHMMSDGTLGARAKRRLLESENYEDLALLAECDKGGRVRGAIVPEVLAAIEHLRSMET